MKKSLLFLALVLLLLLFVSCSKDGEDNKTIENDTQRQTESENETPQPESEVMDDISEDKNSEKEVAYVETEVLTDIVSVNKGIMETYEWAEGDAAMKARNKTTYIVLNEKEREKYPSLAQKLDEIADLCIKSADADLENLIYLADQQLEMYDGFNTQTSTLDMHIRRSDSTVFSMLSDSYMDTTYIEDLRAIHGSNYDTKSGKELAITDVVKDITKFAEIVEDELFSHMWGGELLCDTAVKDYFDNRTPEGVSWSLDYNGVTIYFNRGDIAEPVFGLVPVTVSFEEHPELFREKYTKAPEAYIMKLPLNCSSFLDINNDGKLEEFVVSAHYDEEYRFYSDIYLITSTDFYEENYFSYGFNPYYIKTSDDSHFLYLFGEGSDDWNRLMNLYVYEITGGKLKKMGEMPIAPHHSVSDDGVDVFDIPTDPDAMYLDMFSEEPGFVYPAFTRDYEVSAKGMPKAQGESETISAAPEFTPESFVETELGIIDFFETKWYGYRFVDGKTGIPTPCDNENAPVMIEFFNTGRGLLTNAGQYMDFLWSVEENKGVFLDMNGEYGYYGTVYRNQASQQDWLMVQIDGNILWLYRQMPDGGAEKNDADNITEFAKALNLDSCEGNPDFAVAFLGYGEELWEQARLCIEDIFSSLDEELITQVGCFNFEGDEWYLIIPIYKADVDVKNLNTGEIKTMHQGFPFTVKCNLSSLHSNIEISTDINEGQSFSPQMGGDGRLVTTDCIWDITEYN